MQRQSNRFFTHLAKTHVVAQLQIHPRLRMHIPVKQKRSNRHRHCVITASGLSNPPLAPNPTLVTLSLLYPSVTGGTVIAMVIFAG